MAESKEITYPNALASNGKIVNVNDPEFQDRSLTYTCLGCGEPMCAVHRTTGQSHFRHINSNPNCNPQTYLHRLAKRMYKEWFDSGKPFNLSYKSQDLCKYFDICCYRTDGEEEKCMSNGRHTIDLHSMFDTCQEEVGYKGFIGDLVLTNSQKPEQKPLFLEIAVTHKCDEEKIASGIPIIELDIQTEEDIKLPLSEYGDLRNGIKLAAIYNFDRKVPSKKIYNTHQITASSLIQDYRNHLIWDSKEGPCSQILQHFHPRLVCAHFFSKEDAEKIGKSGLQELIWASSSSIGIHPNFCLFCNKARKKNSDSRKFGDYFCKTAEKNLLKSLNCPGFEFDGDVVLDVLEKYKDYHYLSIGFSKGK